MDPGEFCGQTAGAEFPGYAGKIDCQGELNRLPRLITAGWRSTDMDADILKKYLFGNGLRQLGLRGENNPVKGRARSLIYCSVRGGSEDT